MCLDSTDLSCVYDIKENLASQLQADGWHTNSAVTDGYINDAWTEPDTTASMIAGERPNLLYVNTHGGIVNGQAYICLRNCDESGFGSDYSFGPPTLPFAWNGPNWLVIDSCSAVLPNIGWENTFGGSLHGILGWNSEVQASEDDAQAEFTKLIAGYDSAADAWENATALSPDSESMEMLIPATNASDSIEASGGPHFGPNGSTNPQAYFIGADGQVVVSSVSKLSSAPQAIYALVPEQMDEAYWNSYYGGGSVPSTVTHPSSNENLYRNQYALVDHYLASGGLFVATAATGTARGFSSADAYQYALNWIQTNGGLPSDAVLTYAGDETVSPTATQPTSDQPYPGTRQYTFVWRHANSAILDHDKIQINVDDAGKLTLYSKPGRSIYNAGCQCMIQLQTYYYGSPWVPVYHIHTYVRLWRSLGAPIQAFVATRTAQSYGYCSSDMVAVISEAIPCGITAGASGVLYQDLKTGASISSSEAL